MTHISSKVTEQKSVSPFLFTQSTRWAVICVLHHALHLECSGDIKNRHGQCWYVYCVLRVCGCDIQHILRHAILRFTKNNHIKMINFWQSNCAENGCFGRLFVRSIILESDGKIMLCLWTTLNTYKGFHRIRFAIFEVFVVQWPEKDSLTYKDSIRLLITWKIKKIKHRSSCK